MSQIQRKAFHFILYLLLETRCTKRKGDELNEIQCSAASAYFAKKEFTGKTTVQGRKCGGGGVHPPR